jgi:hypothetical protein
VESFGPQLVAGVVLDEDADVVLDGRASASDVVLAATWACEACVPVEVTSCSVRWSIKPVAEHCVFHWVT